MLVFIPLWGIYYPQVSTRLQTMHPSHKEHLGKLNRVSGQVEGVKRMIDEGKYCVDIMTQIRAARSRL